MPRPKKPGGPEPKKRSRNGCWPCKNRKIKCGEEKPKCQNCERQGETCDYSIRLNWEGRTKRKSNDFVQDSGFSITAPCAPPAGVFERTLSDSAVQRPILGASLYNADSQNTPDVSDIAGNVQSKRKSASIGDAYSLASASRSPSMFEDQHQFSSYLSPPGKLTIDPSLAREGSVSTAPEDDSPKQPVPEMSSAIGTPGSQRSARDHISAAQLSRIRDQSTTSYPSPADSGMDSPPFSSHAQTNHPPYHSQSNTQMPPPLPGTSASYLGVHRKSQEEISQLGDLALKRQRLSPSVESSDGGQRHYSTPYTAFSGSASTKTITSYHSPQPPFQSYSPSNGYGSIALTPTGSSVASEDNHSRANIKPSPYTKQESPDRRLSVSSLLSGPPGGDDSFADSGGESSFAITSYNGSQIRTQMINYGVDRGFPDLDLPTNNDAIALNGYTPATTNANYGRLGAEPTEEQYVSAEFGFGLHTAESAHEEQGYYEKPVTVSIPRSLGTLPPTLLENPMNLLYFHHFLNHTASILVPHDCSENPFKSILPEMAVRDSNLLNLLLAYSASHRARLLKHPEPANRIALWVQDVFPNLRRALDDPSGQVSNANLATAIMLASLEIISPNTFEVPVTWQNHLNVARRMLLARGGAGSVHRKDTVSYFLSRWFAYLDVLGSLSGGKNDQPLFCGNYWAADDAEDEEHAFQIDCLLGFTSRCVSILAKIAALARLCDSERIDTSGNIREDWIPPDATITAAEKLKADLQEARTHRYSGCPHRHAGNEIEDGWDSLEMIATNDAFHWAGQVHLNRRVLGKESSDPEVQMAVREIVGALYKVRKGGTAEACLLFPMFTAGCDAQEPGQRDKIMERLKVVEGTGMTHVKKARRLMEKVWETGRPWETLVSGEFFG